VVGRNGAGKSTLLQMVCGTLQPSVGELQVNGRVAALLELGAGFSPDFTGLENIYMNAAILGLSRAEVDQRLDDIVGFADIGDFIRQPVKTYSSGMFMRLAFSVATAVEPDILVIDEALSVGDGAFARKSFDRIMKLKDAGKTILFCSHSMYQVEALCSRAMWVDGGTVREIGPAAQVTGAYQASLNAALVPVGTPTGVCPPAPSSGTARITGVSASADGTPGKELPVRSGRTDVKITIDFAADPALPVPAVALGISDANGLTVASATTHNDGLALQTDASGRGSASIVFPRLPLLKGVYWVTVFLATEDGIHVYEHIERCLRLDVTQDGLEQGVVALPHEWLA
jgi:lipopolysaccharide transport system ATP-binding protein